MNAPTVTDTKPHSPANTIRIGYARVSTRAQDHLSQMQALESAHCREIVEETASTRKERPKLRVQRSHATVTLLSRPCDSPQVTMEKAHCSYVEGGIMHMLKRHLVLIGTPLLASLSLAPAAVTLGSSGPAMAADTSLNDAQEDDYNEGFQAGYRAGYTRGKSHGARCNWQPPSAHKPLPGQYAKGYLHGTSVGYVDGYRKYGHAC
ncbi:recombinase family protein [Nonomuraea dietziae]|uniref:recombinase family protein n=1 Tax=Nonomuraea dietziae TaxID=65515 RepID=UPI003412ACE5